ncbi:hypothetical protein FOZ62_012858, partial [Perkinsus olseni]
RVTGITERLNELSAIVSGLADSIEVQKLGGTITTGQGECVYKDDHGTKTTISFASSADSPSPISGTYISGKSSKQATYNKDFTQLNIVSWANSMDITITDHLPQALQHFASLIPFAHFNDEVLRKLWSSLPITKEDNVKCRRIFSLLVDNPPKGYESSRARWFTDFNEGGTSGAWGVVRSWRYGLTRRN